MTFAGGREVIKGRSFGAGLFHAAVAKVNIRAGLECPKS